jgi:lytic murein transglycosylase
MNGRSVHAMKLLPPLDRAMERSRAANGLFGEKKWIIANLSIIIDAVTKEVVPWRVLAAALALALALSLGVSAGSAQSDPAFRAFLEQIWPDARARGVSRATFETETRDLTPDLDLPDLVIPGRAPPPDAGQAEFTQAPAEYLSERALQNLAGRGRRLWQQHRAALAGIEARFGVPGPILLAIWGRETAFGEAKLPYDVLRVLATQAYVGRRKERFREEFISALKLVEDGRLTPARRRSSWAGAMGLVQFLPSDYERYGSDGDGDGVIDIWASVPDALASAASQLAAKGWRPGRRWAHELRAPQGLDCTLADPAHKLRLSEWLRRGFVPVAAPAPAELTEEASLLVPAGASGPAFLIGANYFVIKEYNFSDLYVLFVGNLADRIAGGGAFATPWPALPQMRTRDIEELQRRLTELGFYAEKIDGKAGMATRFSLGHFQKAHGGPVDCWPSPAALERLRAAR